MVLSISIIPMSSRMEKYYDPIRDVTKIGETVQVRFVTTAANKMAGMIHQQSSQSGLLPESVETGCR